MNITYICHSSFLVETAVCYYLFDYYKGALPPLKTDKPILVFASHSHSDHYNPAVFEALIKLTNCPLILPCKRYFLQMKASPFCCIARKEPFIMPAI